MKRKHLCVISKDAKNSQRLSWGVLDGNEAKGLYVSICNLSTEFKSVFPMPTGSSFYLIQKTTPKGLQRVRKTY